MNKTPIKVGTRIYVRGEPVRVVHVGKRGFGLYLDRECIRERDLSEWRTTNFIKKCCLTFNDRLRRWESRGMMFR